MGESQDPDAPITERQARRLFHSLFTDSDVVDNLARKLRRAMDAQDQAERGDPSLISSSDVSVVFDVSGANVGDIHLYVQGLFTDNPAIAFIDPSNNATFYPDDDLAIRVIKQMRHELRDDKTFHWVRLVPRIVSLTDSVTSGDSHGG